MKARGSCEIRWRRSADKHFEFKERKSDFSFNIMGKTKAKKRSFFRNRPTGLPSVKEAQREEENNTDVVVKTLPLMEKVNTTEDKIFLGSD